MTIKPYFLDYDITSLSIYFYFYTHPSIAKAGFIWFFFSFFFLLWFWTCELNTFRGNTIFQRQLFAHLSNPAQKITLSMRGKGKQVAFPHCAPGWESLTSSPTRGKTKCMLAQHCIAIGLRAATTHLRFVSWLSAEATIQSTIYK